MKKYSYIILFLVVGIIPQVYSQKVNYIVRKCSFSSGIDDEFSPVFYKDDIVYCSNLRDNSLVSYKNGDERLFNIVYVSGRGKESWKRPQIFSKDLLLKVNVGPASFSHDGNQIYFDRNITIGRNQRSKPDDNKLGIYKGEFVNGRWGNISLLSFDDLRYNYCTPSISPDGSRIYFASDIPGGYGGMDLYYCNAINGDWGKPVNLGPTINTPLNESFPFAASFGLLYFASEGHNGLGGKDIYYTRELSGKWIEPVHLDSAINSPYDDFGFVSDSTFEHGYFSSNRLKTDDIFSFKTAPAEFSSCDSIKENKYCYTLYDERHNLIDTVQAIYVWDFGEGVLLKGQEVKHCFPGPGRYSVSLSIFDALTGDTIAEKVKYDIDLDAIAQASIESYDIGLAGNPITFSGVTESIKGESITGFFWDFGEGFMPGGQTVTHSFNKEGDYSVKLGLTSKADSSGNSTRRCVLRKIKIFGSGQEISFSFAGTIQSSTGNAENDESCRTFTLLPFIMSDISQHQKQVIDKMIGSINFQSVKLRRSGLDPASIPLMENIKRFLKENLDIAIEMIVHSDGTLVAPGKIEFSQSLAQELAYYFKNAQLDQDHFRSYSTGSDTFLFKTNLKPAYNNNVVELVFMKK